VKFDDLDDLLDDNSEGFEKTEESYLAEEHGDDTPDNSEGIEEEDKSPVADATPPLRKGEFIDKYTGGVSDAYEVEEEKKEEPPIAEDDGDFTGFGKL
jgi:hypothetical protein